MNAGKLVICHIIECFIRCLNVFKRNVFLTFFHDCFLTNVFLVYGGSFL